MTRRERVIQALRHHDTDIVPYSIDFTKQSYERLVDYTGDPSYKDRIGNHLIGAGYATWEEIKPGYWRDQFGVVWNRTGADRDIGVVDHYVLPEPTLGDYTFPEIRDDVLRWNCETVLEQAGDRFSHFNIGFSTFERAWTMRGMENLLADMVAEPEFVHELLDVICEFNLRVMEKALAYPFDGFMFGDDWGQQRGTIMGARHWRTFIKPRMARVFERAKREGRFVALHCCGDIHELFPDLIDIGLDIYQTFQPEIYDVKAVKREFGGDLTFWGGISTQRVLPWVSPAEVKRVAREMMQTMGAGGGYIAAPTHAVPGDVPPENVVALVECLQSQ